MKLPLLAVGSTPPRSVRGRTFLPEGIVTMKMQWANRIIVLLLMLVVSPVSPLVAAWWLWGFRRRVWRWHMVVPAVVSVAAAAAVVHKPLAGGVAVWRYILARAGVHIGEYVITGGSVSVIRLLVGGWIVGTVVGVWMSFLAWWRTPPWRDRPRPKTLLVKRREHALTAALADGAGDVEGLITFGIDQDTGQAVELPWKDTDGHILITGAPGTGKTTSALKIVRASIRDGMFTAIVDMKGAPDIIESTAAWCARWDRPLWVFSADGPGRYDPFRHGDFTRKRDLLMATSTWSEAHYQAKASDYLLTVFYLLDILGVAGQSWLHTVADLLNPNNLIMAANKLPAGDPRTAEARARVARVADEAMNDQRSISGMGPRVRALTDTILGQWVQPGEPYIDLMDIWNQSGVVIFSLPSLTYPEGAAAFGGLAVQDLKTLAGTLQDQKNTKPGLVFVDEFANLGAQNVTSALAMARGSRLRWALATQDLGDLAVGEDGRAFEQRILTDTNIKIIHGVGDPETAERLAALAGMKWGVTERTAINQANSTVDISTSTQSGHGYIDRKLVPVIEPNDILHQGAGAGSTFTLINKPGMYAITRAHTVPDISNVDVTPRAAQHLPARFKHSGALDVTSAADNGWWE